MSSIRSRFAVASAAAGLAVASATGGALIAGGAPAGAAAKSSTAKPCAKGKGKGMRELRTSIAKALKAAHGGKHQPLTPDAVKTVVAPVVKAAVAKGTVTETQVKRRAARLQAMADAFGG